MKTMTVIALLFSFLTTTHANNSSCGGMQPGNIHTAPVNPPQDGVRSNTREKGTVGIRSISKK